MATVRPLNDESYLFSDVLVFLELLALDTVVEQGDAREDGFTAEFFDPAFGLSYEVRGTDLAYDFLAPFVLQDGRIEEVDVLFDGVPLMAISDLGLEVDVVADAVERVVGGDQRGIADVLSGLDYDYRGTDLGEFDLLEYLADRGIPFDLAGDDVFDLGGGPNAFSAGTGDDRLIGGPEEDHLNGGPGDDVITGGGGGDTIRGDTGDDAVVLDALLGAGSTLLRSDLLGGDTVYAISRADLAYDAIAGVERFLAGGVDGQALALAEIPRFDALAYGASHRDLSRELGTDEAALLRHYLETGFFEGREVTYDGGQYLANYADLRAAFEEDEGAAARHFIENGREEGRLPADPLAYVASFADLSNAFGDLPEEAMRAAGLRHHQRFGAEEGRARRIDFDADDYLANHADLRAAFGEDEDAAALHYIRFGREEDRLTEDGLRYVASSDGLIGTVAARGLTSEDAIRAFATGHFQRFGVNEARDVDFDADAYLSNYADLRAAFADGEGGYDEDAATLHYILHGFEEGRTDELILA